MISSSNHLHSTNVGTFLNQSLFELIYIFRQISNIDFKMSSDQESGTNIDNLFHLLSLLNIGTLF